MDIAYLLWLQQLREALGPVFEQIMVIISAVAANAGAVAVPLWIYWCRSRKVGTEIIFIYVSGQLLNQLLKNIFCVYRPWIRDSRIHPSEAALPGATGYSFPSGHTGSAGTLAGSIGYTYGDRFKGLRFLCYFWVILVAFSRNVLGCHTPQDVIVAIIEAVFVIWLGTKLLSVSENYPGRRLHAVAAGFILTAVYLAFITLKQYPMDYIGGELIVDPKEMMLDCWKAAGAFCSFLLSVYLERKYVRFETEGLTEKQRVIRLLVGVVIAAIGYVGLGRIIRMFLDPLWASFLRLFILLFFTIFLAPAVFKAMEKKDVQRM